MQIREATPSDAEALVALSTQLGYPMSTAAIGGRLERLLPAPDQAVYVAVDDAGAVIGWVHGAEQLLLESGARCEILGLVVDQDARRQGVGRALVVAVERWAAARGLGEISVRSAVTRAESHPFYERLGYRRVKTQHVYRRHVAPLRTGLIG